MEGKMYAPFFGVKPPMDEMDKLVELLRSKKFSSQDEVEAYLKANREKKREREPNKFIFNERAASIVYPNGFVMSIALTGDITWAYDGKKVDDDTATPIIDVGDLRQCLDHIISHYRRLDQQLTNTIQQWQTKAEEGRTRYVKNDTKRAFVAGMIHGKKNP